MNPSNLAKTSYKDYLKSKGYTSKSIDSYLRSNKLFLQWLPQEILQEQVTYQDILAFMQHCRNQELKQRTIQNYLLGVQHYYDYLLKNEVVTENPTANIEVKGIKRKVLYHVLESHHLHALYHHYPTETLSQKRNKVILGLLVYQGLKTEELAKLETDHIKIREGKIEVPGGARSNGRTLKLESHQVLDLYDYLMQTRKEILTNANLQTEQLFTGTESLGRMTNFITRIIKQLKKHNIENAQQIRASVITKWLKRYNLREVQYRAGHRYVSSTEAYLQNDLEGLQEEINQFHPLG